MIWNISQSVVICHVRLCIVINHSPSLYDYRKHKLTFQIINHWWYNVSLFSQNTARIVNKKVKNNKKHSLLSCFHVRSSQSTFYHNRFFIGKLGKHHVHLTGLVSVIFSMPFFKVIIVLLFNSEILVKFLSWNFECIVPFFCMTFCHWLI